MAERKYSHAGHVDRVCKASAAKGRARAVLLEACRRAEHDKPEVTFTKDQICDTLNTSRRTVQRALQELRDEGALIPIKNHAGGHAVATTYRLVIIGQGAAPVTFGSQNRSREDILQDPREKRFRALARKYGALRATEMMNE